MQSLMNLCGDKWKKVLNIGTFFRISENLCLILLLIKAAAVPSMGTLALSSQTTSPMPTVPTRNASGYLWQRWAITSVSHLIPASVLGPGTASW